MNKERLVPFQTVNFNGMQVKLFIEKFSTENDDGVLCIRHDKKWDFFDLYRDMTVHIFSNMHTVSGDTMRVYTQPQHVYSWDDVDLNTSRYVLAQMVVDNVLHQRIYIGNNLIEHLGLDDAKIPVLEIIYPLHRKTKVQCKPMQVGGRMVSILDDSIRVERKYSKGISAGLKIFDGKVPVYYLRLHAGDKIGSTVNDGDLLFITRYEMRRKYRYKIEIIFYKNKPIAEIEQRCENF